MSTKNDNIATRLLTIRSYTSLLGRVLRLADAKRETHARLGFLPPRLFPMLGGLSSPDRRAVMVMFHKAGKCLPPAIIGTALLLAAGVGAIANAQWIVSAAKVGIVLSASGWLAAFLLATPFLILREVPFKLYSAFSADAIERYSAARAAHHERVRSDRP